MADDNTTYPSFSFRGTDVYQAINIPVARRIAQTYRLILQDALSLDPGVDNACSKRLVHSLWYFLYGPLQDVLINARRGQAGDGLAVELILLHNKLVLAETNRLRSYEEALKYISSLDQRMVRSLQISAVSPLENLVRLCWRRKNPVFSSLGAFVTGLQGLTGVRQADRHTLGIPRVIFICAGHLPNYFVAESVSAWGSMTRMNSWTLKARLRRFRPNEKNAEIPIKTRKFHEMVVTRYNSTQGLNLPLAVAGGGKDSLHLVGLTDGQRGLIIAARRWATSHNNDWFDHALHAAIPLYSKPPTFRPRHRCYKCRAIYSYNIIQDLGGPLPTERNTDDFFDDANYPALSCAEVLCHCFCTRAEAAVEEQKAKQVDKPGSSSSGSGAKLGGGSTTGGTGSVVVS